MGLDIMVYTHVRALPPADVTSEDEGQILAFVLPGFEQSLRGLEPDRWYVGEWIDDFALPYTAYGAWRRALCVAALGVPAEDVWNDPDRFREQPFFEIIHFADNEGTIGPDACADLAADFQAHRDRLLPVLIAEREWFGQFYDRCHFAFSMAGGGGLVAFG